LEHSDTYPLAAPARIQITGFVLDLQRRRLLDPAGTEVELRPQAFDVLRHLALNAGRLVTKDELMATVWPHVVVTDDSLVQAVGDVRRALGAAGPRAIRTVPRRGYVLTADAGNEAAGGVDAGERAVVSAAATASPAAAAVEPRRASALRWPVVAAGVLASAALMVALLPLWRGSASRDVAPAMAVDGARPGAPSVAVLPFDNFSADGAGTWFSEGLSIGISSALARATGLPVLSRQSSTKAASANALPLDRHAAYVLSGGVRHDAQRLRATVQLAESTTGRIVWSERYDRPLRDVFAVEDEITLAVASALQVKLLDGEQARRRVNRTGNLDAWVLAVRGYLRFEAAGRDGYADAKQLFEQALALDPDYAWARAFLGATHFLQARFGFAADRDAALRSAFEEASAAIRLDPGLPDAHSTLGSILLARGDYDAALAAGRKAVSLAPNEAGLHAVLSQTLLANGHWTEAVAASRRAVQLSPTHPSWWLVPDIVGSTFAGRADEAVAAGQRMLAAAESPFMRNAALLVSAFALAEAGRIDEARRMIAERLPLQPQRSARELAAVLFFRDRAHAERYAKALEAAGIPP
jgi:TolB-like protein/DNA-binding winged helix-turn-helix (wHTH) protein/cytochrome c-type biogenesis protein CcmH/NrfG